MWLERTTNFTDSTWICWWNSMESRRKTDGNDMKTQYRSLIEGVVTAAIILVLLQTLAEDILVISGAAWSIRKLFIYTGFAFDLFFTFEFNPKCNVRRYHINC